MKFCKNCSAALDDNAMFCTECGASLTDDFKPADSNSTSSQNNTGFEGFQGSIPTPSNKPNNNNAGGNEYSAGNNYSSNNDYSSNNNYSSNTNYSQPNQYSAPQGKNPGNTWLIVSIISLFCCGGLFAIPGLILAIMSTTSFNAGNVMEAEQRANTAKWLTIGAIIVAVLVIILALATGVFAGLSEGYYY